MKNIFLNKIINVSTELKENVKNSSMKEKREFIGELLTGLIGVKGILKIDKLKDFWEFLDCIKLMSELPERIRKEGVRYIFWFIRKNNKNKIIYYCCLFRVVKFT